MHASHNVSHPPGKVTIELAPPGKLARTVISRSNCKVTYKVPSFRMGAILHAESIHECNFIRRCDVDPEVHSLVMQPATLWYLDAGVLRKHYPDCLVTRTRPSRIFVEIKSADDPQLDEARHRADLLIPDLAQQGYGYELITSDEINAYPFFNNARLLLRLGRKEVSVIDTEAIRLRLLRAPHTTWRHIVDGALGPEGAFQVARLIIDGMLTFDSSRILGKDTVISISRSFR